MSFLIDAPWLYATGEAYGRLAPEAADETRDAKLGAATIAGFWGLSVPLYLNMRWTNPVWKACRAKSGRDWMINSGVLRFDEKNVSRRGHIVAALLFATYPMWLWLGYLHGTEARRRSM